MSSNWTTKSVGKDSSGGPPPDEADMDKEAVILLEGSSVFGDKIYSYVKLTLKSMLELKEKMRAGAPFKPSDFGTVIAAGKGDPTPELRSEMAVKYNLMEVQHTSAPPPKVATHTVQPKVWGEEDEQS